MNLLKTNKVEQNAQVQVQFLSNSISFKVSSHVVLIRDNQNDRLKTENPDFRFYSLYPHVPLWESDMILRQATIKLQV